MEYILEFKAMHSLKEREKQILRALTIPPEIGRSLFRQWLDHPNPLGIFVSIVYDGNILGWSSVNTRTG